MSVALARRKGGRKRMGGGRRKERREIKGEKPWKRRPEEKRRAEKKEKRKEKEKERLEWADTEPVCHTTQSLKSNNPATDARVVELRTTRESIAPLPCFCLFLSIHPSYKKGMHACNRGKKANITPTSPRRSKSDNRPQD